MLRTKHIAMAIWVATEVVSGGRGEDVSRLTCHVPHQLARACPVFGTWQGSSPCRWRAPSPRPNCSPPACTPDKIAKIILIGFKNILTRILVNSWDAGGHCWPRASAVLILDAIGHYWTWPDLISDQMCLKEVRSDQIGGGGFSPGAARFNHFCFRFQSNLVPLMANGSSFWNKSGFIKQSQD